MSQDREIVKFAMVRENGTQPFQDTINRMLGQGWKIKGDVITFENSHEVYFQMEMVKYKTYRK